MKRFLFSIIGILSVVTFFSFCYYFSYTGIVHKLEEQKQQQNPMILELAQKTDENAGLQPTKSQDIVDTEEVSNEDLIITSTTTCIYEVYDIGTGQKAYYETQPDAEMAGLTRKQLNDKLKQYMKHLSLAEFEKGLISFELVSFSPEKVVLQKIYDSNKIQYKYLVTLQNEEVTVTYSDGKTVFEYTGITADMLTEDVCENLMKGVPIQTVEELYDYLSGITS